MVRVRLAVAVLAAIALAGCMTSLPTPDYVSVKTPAPYRVSPEGARIDNENYALDSEGYRVNDKGERVGVLDVPAKTAGEQSNPVAGYYISSQGQVAPGKVAQINDQGGYGPVGSPPGSNTVIGGSTATPTISGSVGRILLRAPPMMPPSEEPRKPAKW